MGNFEIQLVRRPQADSLGNFEIQDFHSSFNQSETLASSLLDKSSTK